ncbi:hypothetical protein CCP4SC76_6960001 [Gammaproteobacteria bacterium]
MNPIPEDLSSRRAAWDALSDLFLDTDVSLSRTWRIEKLAELPYTIAELEQILIDEVYPICKYNLLSGVWTGFDPGWLEREILRRLASPLRCPHAFNIGRIPAFSIDIIGNSIIQLHILYVFFKIQRYL